MSNNLLIQSNCSSVNLFNSFQSFSSSQSNYFLSSFHQLHLLTRTSKSQEILDYFRLSNTCSVAFFIPKPSFKSFNLLFQVDIFSGWQSLLLNLIWSRNSDNLSTFNVSSFNLSICFHSSIETDFKFKGKTDMTEAIFFHVNL